MASAGRSSRRSLQRRHADLDGVDAEEQILTEASGRDFLVQVGIRRRDEPHVHTARSRRAETLELAGLQHAQQLVLLTERDVRNLIEEERPAVGELETADAIRLGVGKRALHVAEELALEHALRDATGVDRDHRALAAGRHGVERPRDEALARAVLARDEDVRVGRPDAGDHLQHRLHGGRIGDDVRLSFAAQHQVLGLEALSAAQRPAQLGLRPHNRQEPRVVPGLLHEIAGAPPHRFDRDLDAAPGGHHDDGQGRIDVADGVQEVEPFLARRRVPRIVEVHQQDVVFLVIDRRQNAGWRRSRLDVIALGLEQQSKSLEDVRLVVGDEEPWSERIAASSSAIVAGVGSWRNQRIGRSHRDLKA